ncbi:hypothetical protein [Larkinella humicola]|uniref:Uncharacterized protein n=1 Tax=Larkinella humicola TaxID=2607654 RepID=A0A5N1J332_9BACT|nr:hypothetical protein [Larkinella humicola]KAA9341148.1 hypothetical protein F0P93_30400 [Larkinella humicola]
MTTKTRRVVPKQRPASIAYKIKQLGLAFKEGWSWIIYPILLIICMLIFNIDTVTIGSILTGLTKLAGKYLLKPK